MEKKKVLDFDVVIEQDEEGYYFAHVPELPGCHTQSEKVEDIIDAMEDANRIIRPVMMMERRP